MSTQILSVEDFERKMTEFAQKGVQSIAKRVAVDLFTEVTKNIVQHTPILSGQARNNWIPTVDTPSGEVIEGETPLGGLGDNTGAAMTGEEVGRLKAVTDRFMASDSTKLCLANNLDYIGRLDEGSSGKAPGGMVQPGISAALAVVKDRGVK